MSFKSSTLLITIAATAIIIFAIAISAVLQGQSVKTFGQIVTVGPVWPSDTWLCTSNKDYIVHGALRGLQGSLLEISISGMGTQSLWELGNATMTTFSVGAPADRLMTISRGGEIVTGWLTLQTESGANASCTPN